MSQLEQYERAEEEQTHYYNELLNAIEALKRNPFVFEVVENEDGSIFILTHESLRKFEEYYANEVLKDL